MTVVESLSFSGGAAVRRGTSLAVGGCKVAVFDSLLFDVRLLHICRESAEIGTESLGARSPPHLAAACERPVSRRRAHERMVAAVARLARAVAVPAAPQHRCRCRDGPRRHRCPTRSPPTVAAAAGTGTDTGATWPSRRESCTPGPGTLRDSA